MTISYCKQADSDDSVVSLEALEAEISISLPKVDASIVRAALVRAAMRIVDKAKMLEYVVTQPFYPGTYGYEVELPDCVTVLNIKKVFLDGKEVPFETKTSNWIELDKNYVNVACTECDDHKLEIHVFGGISPKACEIPKSVYERYGDDILNMTLSRLYGMNGEEWYDPNLVRFYGGLGKQGVTDAKQDKFEQQSPEGIPIVNPGLIL